MHTEYTPCVLDGAPIFLSTRSDLANVRQDAICVGAVLAVEFFHGVEIRKLSPVERQVICAAHAGNPIHREACHLVHPHKQVEQQQRNDQRIDCRCAQDHGQTCTHEVAEQALLQQTVPRNDRMFEANGAFVHFIVQLDAPPGERRFELSFQRMN